MRQYDRSKDTKYNFNRKQGYFYENSNGRVVDLNIPPFIGVRSNDLLSFKWTYVTQGQAVQKIVKFEKNVVEKKFEVLITANTEDKYLGYLEQFLQLTDIDINNVQMGKLWFDDYYLEGYIFASTKNKRYLGTNKTLIELSVVCEKGNWQSEFTKTFRQGVSDSEEEQVSGYGNIYEHVSDDPPFDAYGYGETPYHHGYDYGIPFTSAMIVSESYLDSDFQLTFYGPWDYDPTDPDDLGTYITIGGNDYRIRKSLDVDDKLVVNSKTKTATIVHYDGTTENVFAYRDKSWNLFEKIKGGTNRIIKPEQLVVEVKLFYERSEPKYTEAIWT